MGTCIGIVSMIVLIEVCRKRNELKSKLSLADDPTGFKPNDKVAYND